MWLSVCSVMVATMAPAQTSNATTKTVAANPYSLHVGAPRRAKLIYGLDWGVDSLSVKSTEQGALIRFSYRVLDPEKAAVLNDEKVQPYLIGERLHVKLVIPSLEKVGQLRNKNKPEEGKSYWMAFSNKGSYVKPGDLVTVVIGNFHASGLVVR